MWAIILILSEFNIGNIILSANNLYDFRPKLYLGGK